MFLVLILFRQAESASINNLVHRGSSIGRLMEYRCK